MSHDAFFTPDVAIIKENLTVQEVFGELPTAVESALQPDTGLLLSKDQLAFVAKKVPPLPHIALRGHAVIHPWRLIGRVHAANCPL